MSGACWLDTKGTTSTEYGVGVFAYADANKIPTCINLIDPGTGQ